MCDVELDGVISCPDAPSIYDIPKVLHREQLDAYVVRKLGLPFRDVDWTVWGDLLTRVHEPRETVTVALRSASTSTSRTVPVGDRGDPRRGLRRPREDRDPLVQSDDCATDAGAAAHLGDVDAILIPVASGSAASRARSVRSVRPPPRGPAARAVPGPAVHRHRGSPRGRTDRRQLRRVRPGHRAPVISTMADQEQAVAGEADLGRTMRLGAYPAVLERGSMSQPPTARRRCRAAPPSLRGEQRLPLHDREHRLTFSGTSPRRPPRRVRRVPARDPPVPRRHPGAPRAEEPTDASAPAFRCVRSAPR